MNKVSVPLPVVVLLLVLVVAALMSPLARSQIQASPNLIPIGVSSSGNVSTVWFHEPNTRQALACSTAVGPNAASPSIQCVGTKLP